MVDNLLFFVILYNCYGGYYGKNFKRENYLNKIRGFYDDTMIKVITGIRRCGKSTLLKSVIEELKENGIQDKDIIYI